MFGRRSVECSSSAVGGVRWAVKGREQSKEGNYATRGQQEGNQSTCSCSCFRTRLLLLHASTSCSASNATAKAGV